MWALCFSHLDDVSGLQEPAERSMLLGALALWKWFPGEPCALLMPLLLSLVGGGGHSQHSAVPLGWVGFPAGRKEGGLINGQVTVRSWSLGSGMEKQAPYRA